MLALLSLERLFAWPDLVLTKTVPNGRQELRKSLTYDGHGKAVRTSSSFRASEIFRWRSRSARRRSSACKWAKRTSKRASFTVPYTYEALLLLIIEEVTQWVVSLREAWSLPFGIRVPCVLLLLPTDTDGGSEHSPHSKHRNPTDDNASGIAITCSAANFSIIAAISLWPFC